MRKEEKKGKRRICLTVVVLALFFCLISTITLAGATVVKVIPATQTVTAGGSFSVNVNVEDVTKLGMCDMDLNFDPGAMQATGIVEGDFLKSAGSTLPIETIDNMNGKVTFSYSLMTFCVGASGSGVLATINFNTNPAAPGKYNLDLTNVNLADCAASPITVGVSEGKVTIQPIPVPGLSGTGMVVAIGVLAVVLAISSMRKRRE